MALQKRKPNTTKADVH